MKILCEINKIVRWINILQKNFKDYNNSKHRTIGMKRIEFDKSYENDLLENIFKFIPPNMITTSTFEIGDKVRISN